MTPATYDKTIRSPKRSPEFLRFLRSLPCVVCFRSDRVFPDNEAARLYLEARLWPNGTICPDCKGDRISRTKRVGFYHCNACNFDFTIRTGTIFERSKIPLNKWLYAMYLLVTARKGISKGKSHETARKTESQTCSKETVTILMYIIPF